MNTAPEANSAELEAKVVIESESLQEEQPKVDMDCRCKLQAGEPSRILKRHQSFYGAVVCNNGEGSAADAAPVMATL